MAQFKRLEAGDPAPFFAQRSPTTERFNIDTVAGRYLVLSFHVSAASPAGRAALAAVDARKDLFDDTFASFFGVSNDPADEREGRVRNETIGIRHLWDFDLTASRLYGAASIDTTGPTVPARPIWVIIDPTMRVIDVIPMSADGTEAAEVMNRVAALPPPVRFAGPEIMAPVLFLPRVFEADFCDHLIGLYEAQGGELSGFMRQVDGKTVGLHDSRHKVRRDVMIEDQALMAEIQKKIVRRIVPEIQKVHAFNATRMERYLVACYDASEGGHFRAHRDNTTAGTAHRRFAVSINLNDDFEGGEVSFPEYGPRSFKAPRGGAVVFSCSLLHAVSRVTSGRRFAFLPFLYDDAAARVRAENLKHIEQLAATAADPAVPKATA